jgi:UrcA family protein
MSITFRFTLGVLGAFALMAVDALTVVRSAEPVPEAVLGAFALMAVDALSVARSAEALPEVTVTAYRPVSKLGRDANGQPVEAVRLSREVSYADLDLSTYTGATKLQARIKIVANAVCKELEETYPMSTEAGLPSGTCVQEAINSATPQLKVAIAAAEKAGGASRRE